MLALITNANRQGLRLNPDEVSLILEVLKEEIEKRDYQDTHREVSPLKKADDAIVVDSSDLSIDEVVSEILDIIHKKVMEGLNESRCYSNCWTS